MVKPHVYTHDSQHTQSKPNSQPEMYLQWHDDDPGPGTPFVAQLHARAAARDLCTCGTQAQPSATTRQLTDADSMTQQA